MMGGVLPKFNGVDIVDNHLLQNSQALGILLNTVIQRYALAKGVALYRINN
jgi:hypothetical protein